MTATLCLDSERVYIMNDEDFNNEMHYHLTMHYVRQLKRDGAISDEEYQEIDEMLLKKHRPIIGTLLAGKSLL